MLDICYTSKIEENSSGALSTFLNESKCRV